MVKGVQAQVAESARANVSSTRKDVEANMQLVGSFRQVGAAAKVGANEVVEADARAGAAAERAGLKQREAMTHSAKAAHGLRHSLLAVGGVFGIAFGVERLAEFGKSMVEEGIQAQKAQEGVQFAFGKSGEVINKFAEGGAAKLGISTKAAQESATRFGILFKNLGIAPEAAAKMTVGFQQLAGSMSLIRGKPVEQFLQNLPLAAAGNTRALKQMGIAVDSASLKLAFQAISGQKVVGSLTPAQKAVAVYGVATAHLGDLLGQASRKANDAFSTQARLSAEWANAKEKVGVALTPAITKMSAALANWLQRMNESGRLQRDVNRVMGTAKQIIDGVKSGWQTIAPPLQHVIQLLGGTSKAVRDLLIVWAAWKFAGIIGGLSGVGKAAGIASKGLKLLSGESIIARAALLGLTGLGVVAGIAAIGIAAKVAADHVKSLQEQVIKAESRTAAKGSGVRTTLIPAKAEEIRKLRAEGVSTKDILAKLRAELGGSSLADDIIADAFHFSAGKADAQTKRLTDEIVKRKKKVLTDAVKGSTVGSGIFSAGTPVDAVGTQAVRTVAAQLSADDKAAIGKAKDGIDQLKQRFKDANTAARDQINQTKDSLQQLHQNLADAVSQMKTDVADSVQQAQQNLVSIGGSLADSIGQILDQPFKVAGDRISAAQNKLALRFDTESQKLDAQARKLQNQQSRLGLANDREALAALRRQVVLPGGEKLSTDNQRAIGQLQALERRLPAGQRAGIDAFIRQFQGAVLQVEGDRLGLKQTALANRRAVQEGRLNLASEKLRVKQDAATTLKDVAQRQIGDLTDALASGKIKLSTFTKNLAHLMAKDNASYRRAGHLLGTAFEHGFRQQVKGILAQAAALTSARGAGIRVGDALDTKVVKPLDTLHKGQEKISRIQHQIGHQQITLQRRIAHAAEQSHQIQVQIRDRQTALQRKIAKATEKTQAATEKLASVVVNPEAASLLNNPGRQSARGASLTGATG